MVSNKHEKFSEFYICLTSDGQLAFNSDMLKDSYNFKLNKTKKKSICVREQVSGC